MPRWRKLHVKTRQSLDINEMPDDFVRLLWVLMPLGLDREGRGLDNVSWVKAQLVPLRTDVTLEMVSAALDWYESKGMIVRYAVNGRGYFYTPTFGHYQGDTSREAKSEFPAPPDTGESQEEQEPITTNSQPTPEPVMSESSTDSDVDSDSEIDIAPAKRTRASSGKNAVRKALEKYFIAKTKLPRPQMETAKQKRTAAERWWQPLRRIAELTDQDIVRGTKLIDAALQRLEGLTISAPQSILKTAIAIIGERARGIARSTNSPGVAVGPSSRARSAGE